MISKINEFTSLAMVLALYGAEAVGVRDKLARVEFDFLVRFSLTSSLSLRFFLLLLCVSTLAINYPLRQPLSRIGIAAIYWILNKQLVMSLSIKTYKDVFSAFRSPCGVDPFSEGEKACYTHRARRVKSMEKQRQRKSRKNKAQLTFVIFSVFCFHSAACL